MAINFLAVHESLAEASRLRPLLNRGPVVTLSEWITLALAGAGAAWLSSIDVPDLFGRVTGYYPRIPGYTILRTFFPMSIGLALVPRRLAASLMGVIALAVAVTLNQTGLANIGNAAVCSLAVTGPVLDLTLWFASAGWPLLAGFVFSGVASNLIAYVVQGLTKSGSGRHGGMLFADWKWRAAITYPVCGAVVCLVCALIWFRFVRSTRPASMANSA